MCLKNRLFQAHDALTFLKADFVFQSSFSFVVELSRRFRDFQVPPALHMHSFPYYARAPPGGTFVMSDEPTLTCQYHPKSRVSPCLRRGMLDCHGLMIVY